MKHRTNIEVTEGDIARAERGNSYKCVVMQAIARTIPDSTRIEVDTQSIRFTAADERFWFLTPYAVQGYVVAFDAGDTIEPFSFQLRDPVKVKRVKRTAAGLAADRAARHVHESMQMELPNAAKKAPRATSEEAARARSAAYAQAKGQAKTKESTAGDGLRKPPPRVFKTKKRSYGHRVLRINQQEGAEA